MEGRYEDYFLENGPSETRGPFFSTLGSGLICLS